MAEIFNTMVESYTEDSIIFGKTYGNWTVRWWQWALSMPKAVNPLCDKTGENANSNQPTDVWFLAGRFGSGDRWLPKRECIVPYGRPILFPILNCEANPLEYPELKTNEDIINHVRNDVDTIVRKECFVNGERLVPVRVQSDPVLFQVNIAEDVFEIPKSGETLASADGYWMFLKPLRIGEYNIRFDGACEQGRLNSGAEYQIKVE
jgi:hypothetical protein